MHQYGVREVERLLQLPRSTIRGLVKAGFVAPARGPRRAWLFSFRDLVVLRTAQALVAARVPKRRILRSMRELRGRLESGQYPLAFEGEASPIALKRVEKIANAQEWFERGAALERHDVEGAVRAYQRALAAEPAYLDAHTNLGCLLHAASEPERAERAYRAALAACGNVPGLQYNLGVLLQDLGRKEEAAAAYREALSADPALADCHYNLALLCEELGKPRDAIRHMAQYRRLTRK